jgi:hypothetical protein
VSTDGGQKPDKPLGLPGDVMFWAAMAAVAWTIVFDALPASLTMWRLLLGC